MPVVPFNPSTFHWNAPRPHPSGSFRPQGTLERHGTNEWYERNPRGWTSARTVVGRLIVGFSVGTEPRYAMDDLIAIVRRVRTEQTGNPSASFVAQRGIYQSQISRDIVTEDGAQVFIINLSALSDDEFTDQMVSLAEAVAGELQQEEVIVEIQENGVSKVTIGVSP